MCDNSRGAAKGAARSQARPGRYVHHVNRYRQSHPGVAGRSLDDAGQELAASAVSIVIARGNGGEPRGSALAPHAIFDLCDRLSWDKLADPLRG
jgi:hypothetical protein